MHIAILAPVHSLDGLGVIRQLTNYEYWLGQSSHERHYYLHFSSESTDEARKCVARFAEFQGIKVFANESPVTTSYDTCLNAIIMLNRMMHESPFEYTHIYFHSDSDLIFKEGLAEYINLYQCGITILGRLDYESSDWYHANNMRKDFRLVKLVEEHFKGNLSKLYIGRIEGCFAGISIWADALSKITYYFDDAYFDTVSHHWCAEEVLLPSLLIDSLPLLSNPALLTKSVILPKLINKPREESYFTVSDINLVAPSHDIFGGKWFSPVVDDAVRRCMGEV